MIHISGHWNVLFFKYSISLQNDGVDHGSPQLSLRNLRLFNHLSWDMWWLAARNLKSVNQVRTPLGFFILTFAQIHLRKGMNPLLQILVRLVVVLLLVWVVIWVIMWLVEVYVLDAIFLQDVRDHDSQRDLFRYYLWMNILGMVLELHWP